MPLYSIAVHFLKCKILAFDILITSNLKNSKQNIIKYVRTVLLLIFFKHNNKCKFTLYVILLKHFNHVYYNHSSLLKIGRDFEL